MIGGNVGYFITATFTLTLVSLLGRGNRQHGFFFTVLIYALVSFAMLSDTVDYGEYKNHVRASGFLTAVGSAVGLQVGTGLGDFIPLKLMQHFGYVANQEQSAGSLAAMKFGFSYLPAIFFLVGALVMLFYVKYEKKETDVLEELERRRQNA